MKVRFASRAAPGRPANEDQALWAGPLVGVFDGVSEPAGLDTGCIHGPAWYVRRLVSRLAAGSTDRPEAPLTDLLTAAIGAIRDDHGGSCDLGHPGTPAATVCLLRRSRDHADYLILCDSTLIVDRGRDVEVFTDGRFHTATVDIRRGALTGEVPIDSAAHAARVRDAALARRLRTNRPDGYWVAAADPDVARHAVTGVLPLIGPYRVRRAALLTDGASCAVDRYGLMDWRGLLDFLSQHDPADLIRTIRDAEMADRHGRGQPRYKRHDDATALICAFDQENRP